MTTPVVRNAFTGTPLFGASPLTVNFTDTYTGTASPFGVGNIYPESWAWDFGDGQTDTVGNPVNVYAVDGSYDVSLNMLVHEYYITIPFSISATTLILFTNTNGGSAWDWTFSTSGGILETSTDENPTITFPPSASINIRVSLRVDGSTYDMPFTAQGIGSSALRGVTWNGSKYIAVGDGGLVMTSTDGITWSFAFIAGVTEDLYGINWYNNLFIITGTNGTLLTSPDGIVWTPQVTQLTATLICACYGGGYYFAISNYGDVLTSQDGINWSSQGALPSSLHDIVYDGTNFIIVGSNGMVAISSPDCQIFSIGNWGDTTDIFGIAWSGSQYVAVGNVPVGGGDAVIRTSSDATTWTSQFTGTGYAFNSVIYNNGNYVAVNGLTVYTSPTGVVWTPQQSMTEQLIKVVFGDKYVLVGVPCLIASSTDSTTWTTRNKTDYWGVYTTQNYADDYIQVKPAYVRAGAHGFVSADFECAPTGDAPQTPPINGDCPFSVDFTDDSSCDGNQVISRWLWDFGDDCSSNEQNPTHVYKFLGTYDVTLIVYTNGYTDPYTPSGIPDAFYNTKKVIAAVVVNNPTDKTLTDMCLRYAIEETEGIGWSDYTGDNFVDPVEGGAYLIYDDNEVPRCIVEDVDGKIYEIDTYNRVNTLKPSFMDKLDYDGLGPAFGGEGSEIACKKLGAEITAGAGYEDTTVCDYMSWVHLRPDDPLNRGLVGYDSQGMRLAQKIGLEVYIDGEKITPTAQTVDIPENADIVFPGHPNIEATRLQYGITFDASEFKLVEIKNQILAKQSAASPAGVTMSEYTNQNNMASNLVLWLTRGGGMNDRVSKNTIATPNTPVLMVGVDGFQKSGVHLDTGTSEEIFVYSIDSTGINGTFLVWSTGDLTAKAGNDITLISIGVVGSWTLYSATINAAVCDVTIRSLAGTIVEFEDMRFYSDIKTTEDKQNYFSDMKTNQGDAYLPAFI